MSNQAHTHSTNRSPGTGRVKVENGRTAFSTGNQFQVADEFDTSVNPSVLRIQSTDSLILSNLEIVVDLAGAVVDIYSAGTESGTFSDVDIIQTNSIVSPVTPNFTAQNGGELIPSGPSLRRERLKAANALADVLTAERAVSDPIGLPAGTYYVVVSTLEGILVGGSKGMVRLTLEHVI